MAARLEGKKIHEKGSHNERECQPETAETESTPFPDEVAGEQRQNQEADVPGIESVVGADVGVAEQLGNLDGQRGGGGQTDDHSRLDRCRPARLAVLVGNQDQLFPQTLRMLPRELARESVQAAHPLDSHQKGFVRRQAGVDQFLHLFPQVNFQLFHVRGEYCPATAQVSPPLRNLSLQSLLSSPGCAHSLQPSCISGCPCATGHLSNQTARRVASTTCHCRR